MEPIWCYLMFGILGDRDLSARRGWRHHGTEACGARRSEGISSEGIRRWGRSCWIAQLPGTRKLWEVRFRLAAKR